MLLEPGQIFASRYRVVRCIAEGGMAAIFEAEHTAIERRVALKLLFPHIMSVGSARKKFELEARISARVNSPHIVEVLDAGFDEPSKAPYLVMELLEGQTLAERIYERGPLAPRQALRVLQQVAAGLDAAHAYRDVDGTPKPIVHRDLKPDNLFLVRTPDDELIHAKILDYGIAKMLGDTHSLSQEVRGTPLFMAFEQITAGPLSAQTDIWAFGLIAFYMLAGVPYWRSAEREGISVQSLFAEILTLPLELPSVRLREQGSSIELPPGFDAWLLRCIDREPSMRFPSVSAAVEALARVFDVVLEDASPAPVRLLTSAEKTRDVPLEPDPASSAGSLPGPPLGEQRPPARARPSISSGWIAAGVVAGALLFGVISGFLPESGVAPAATVVPAGEPSLPASGRPVDASASGPPGTPSLPSDGTSSSEAAASVERESSLEGGQVDAGGLPDGAAEAAVSASSSGALGPGAPEAPASRGRSSATAVSTGARDQGGRPSPPAEARDELGHPRAPAPAGKPSRPKRTIRPGLEEAYRVR